jgi:hypothetical protein
MSANKFKVSFMENQNNITQEMTQEQWVKEKYQEALKYLADKGVIGTTVKTDECRHLGPYVAVWHISDTNNKSYWVINGDVPTDHVNIDVSKDARDVMRHFSLKWQMQAENLLAADDNSQQEFGKLLINKAENLYRLYEDASVWGAEA